MEQFDTDDFLAKWADGSLSEAERASFKSSDAYPLYQAIIAGTELLEVPPYDRAKLYETIQKNRAEPIKGHKLNKHAKVGSAKTGEKVRPLFTKWGYAVAASVAILIGTFLFMNADTTYKTDVGQQLALTLPDGSQATLNAKSSLRFDQKDWQDRRTLQLNGEAYFKVTKGSTFVVETPNGTVTVLGTQFTVNTEKNTFEAVCFEGKVRVGVAGETTTLTQGQAARWVAGAFETWQPRANEPSWLQNESTFVNAPLHQVITALQKQYGITIQNEGLAKDLRFTGSFTHDNLKVALRTVFESMEIKYTFIDENTLALDPR